MAIVFIKSGTYLVHRFSLGEKSMVEKKWKRVNILPILIKKIAKLVDEEKYSTVPSFVEDAVREKLDRLKDVSKKDSKKQETDEKAERKLPKGQKTIGKGKEAK